MWWTLTARECLYPVSEMYLVLDIHLLHNPIPVFIQWKWKLFNIVPTALDGLRGKDGAADDEASRTLVCAQWGKAIVLEKKLMIFCIFSYYKQIPSKDQNHQPADSTNKCCLCSLIHILFICAIDLQCYY